MSDEELAAAAVVVAVLQKRKTKRRKRKCWVKPWLARRPKLGIYETLLSELRLEEENEYKNYLRMSTENFDELFRLVEKDITKQNTIMRDAISAKVKLAITIRFLSTGESYKSLQYQFRVHHSTLSKFIPEVCETIYRNLKDAYLKVRRKYIFNYFRYMNTNTHNTVV